MNAPVCFLLFALSVTLAGCEGSVSDEYSSNDEDAYADAYADGLAEAEAAARQAAEDADASDVSAYEVENPGVTGCTLDCSGHDAGFEWAQDNDISDESDCGGNSYSFQDGCEQFVQARQEAAEERAREEAEAGAEDYAEEYAEDAMSD